MPTLAEDITALSDTLQTAWAARSDDKIKQSLLETFYIDAIAAVADHPLDGDIPP